MKNIIYCLMLAIMVSACGNLSQKTPPREVGDIIMLGDALGVVFAVTADGQHGKAVSLTETQCCWTDAKTWCANIDQGWRLPTKEELRVIYKKRSIIDYTLSVNGYKKMDGRGKYYWTSKEYDEILAWGIDMSDGSAYPDFKSNTYCHYVRAVSVF